MFTIFLENETFVRDARCKCRKTLSRVPVEPCQSKLKLTKKMTQQKGKIKSK